MIRECARLLPPLRLTPQPTVLLREGSRLLERGLVAA